MLLNLQKGTKSYTNGNTDRHILDDISLNVASGESLAIVGPSGCGKTTLLNVLGTLDLLDAGTLSINDQNIQDLSKDRISEIRNKEIGFVFQSHHLLPQCTLLENILIPTLPQKKDQTSAAEALLRELDIWEVRNQHPAGASGGECQRAAVARALINQPALILADEPTGALDETNGVILIDLLLKLHATRNVALIVVTHSMEIASKMQTIYLLKNGKLKDISSSRLDEK